MRSRTGSGGFKFGCLALALVIAVGSLANDESTLDGRVLGADGVAGVWLATVGEDPEAATWMLVEDGYFEIQAPPGERASLVAIAKDRVPLALPVPPQAQSRPLELRLLRGLALEGTVRTADGRPLVGAEIRLAPVDAIVHDLPGRAGFAFSLRDAKIEVAPVDGRADQVPPFARSTWKTTRRGAFRIDGLKPGRYVVEATLDGFVAVLIRDVAIREDSVNRLELNLFEAFFVTGHVIDREGRPVAGAEVHADWLQPIAAPDLDQGELVNRQARRRTPGLTGDDGSFRLGPLEAGPQLTIFATSPESGSSNRHDVQAPYDGLVLQLRRHVIRGHVVDATTGEPVKSFRLRAHRNGRTHSTHHDDGYFEVPVDPETDSLHIEAPDRFPWFTRLFTSPRGEYDLGEIALERERTVTGRVRDARSGKPISEARLRRSWRHYQDPYLRVFTLNWFGSRWARTGADGTFELGGLPTDADTLEVFVEGSTFARFVDLPRDVTHIEIELASDAVIAGSLLLPDGTPASGTVELWEWAGDHRKLAVAKDGTFRWDGLGAGEYRLTVESDAGAMAGRAVVLRDGKSAEGLRLVVEPGGRVSGTIAGLMRGEQVTVVVRDGKGQTILERELGNGAYSLQGVPNGATIAARTTVGRILGRSVRLDDLGEARVDLDFSGKARLAGTVSADGRPLGGIGIAVVPKDRSQPMAYATTSELGRYAVRGISDGLHTVETRTGHSADVYVAQHATLDIDLPAISLSGTVRADRTDRPVAGGWVRLARVDASADSLAVVLGAPIASDGGFRFEGLAKGEYIVRVSHRDFGGVSRRLHLAGREAVEFRLESDRGGGDGRVAVP